MLPCDLLCCFQFAPLLGARAAAMGEEFRLAAYGFRREAVEARRVRGRGGGWRRGHGGASVSCGAEFHPAAQQLPQRRQQRHRSTGLEVMLEEVIEFHRKGEKWQVAWKLGTHQSTRTSTRRTSISSSIRRLRSWIAPNEAWHVLVFADYASSGTKWLNDVLEAVQPRRHLVISAITTRWNYLSSPQKSR